MMAGTAVFIVNDACVKLLSATLAAEHAIFLRGLIATSIIAIVAALGSHLRPAHLKDLVRPAMLIRTVGDVSSTFLIYLALSRLPLADVTAITMSGPLLTVALAVAVYRETVSAARWLAVLVGFAGVLLIVKPGSSSFDPYMLAPLSIAALQAVREVATRSLPRRLPSILVTLVTAASVTVVAGIWSGYSGLPSLTGHEALLIVTAGLTIGAGYHLLVLAVRVAPLSTVAPFRYSSVVWSIPMGAALFGNFPDALSLLGAAIVVASGLYIVRPSRGSIGA
jgi:drug/metabolite transporter (DMT)-like permease